MIDRNTSIDGVEDDGISEIDKSDEQEIDPQLNWEPQIAPGRAEEFRKRRIKADRKGVMVALAFSISVHAMAAGVIYCIVRPTWNSARLMISPSQTVETGMADRPGNTVPGAKMPLRPSLAVNPLQLSHASVTDPSDDQELARNTTAVSPETFRDSFPSPDDPPPLLSSDRASIRLPLVKRDTSMVVHGASTQSTLPHNASAATKSFSPVRIAGAGMNRHGAKNGYDNRGLPIPDYPAESRRRGEQGLVLLDVEVKPDGNAGAVTVVKDPGFPRLTNAAIEAVREAPFQPATLDGVPVAGHIQIPYRFVLQ